MERRHRFRGCLLGLAVGDAVGATNEFRSRGTLAPLTDMVGGGPFQLKPGQWTDDTSMALCLATSLVECGGFDPRDQIERYCRWYETGYLSSTGRCFDIGNTVRTALSRYRQTGEPYAGSSDPHAPGNGSTMRLAPIPICYYPDEALACECAAESSRTTHATLECPDACRLLAAIILRALGRAGKEQVLYGPAPAGLSAPKIIALAEGRYRDKTQAQIRGSGYVVESLEAALWCFWQTDSFETAIL